LISEFLVYLRLGLEHILDPRGYDHILFIVVLTVMYLPRAWRQIVILVTAFTVGHSVTLALATFGRVRMASEWIEALIAVTILAAATLNLAEVWWSARRAPPTGRPATVAGGLRGRVREGPPSSARGGWDDVLEPSGGRRTKYAFALVFGLVHGLGFSNFLRATLGAAASIVGPLFAFNVGLEIGQILIVALVLTATAVVTGPLGWSRRLWVGVLSGATAVVAVYLVATRLPF
jgi:hypothetical protein